MSTRSTRFSRSNTLRAAIASLLLCGAAGSAHGDDFDGPNAAAARALFDDGMKLLDAGRYAEACPKLEESNRLDPGMGVKYRLALCYESSLRIASAWVLFTQIADQAAAAKLPDREKVARGRAESLRLRLPHMIVVVPKDVASTPGLEIKADGRVLGAAMFGTSLPVDAGAHTVAVSAPGRRTWETTAQASESATMTVTIPQLQEEPVVGPIATGTGQPVPASPGWSGRHTGGVVVAGLGLVGIGIGAVFGMDATGKHADSKAACPSRTGCSARAIELEDQAKGSATGSTVAMIAGGAALAGGAVLFLTAGWPFGASAKDGKSGGAGVRVKASAQGATITVEGGF
jgi:hypothetical protein